jgi:hypothetical protein
LIPAWVPNAARQAIEALWKDSCLDETGRAALVRLATYPAMRTEVWDKLPGGPKSAAGDVIEFAMIAIMAFPLLRPMPTTQKRSSWDRWAQHIRAHPRGLSEASLAGFAAALGHAIGSMSDASWSHHWQGDPQVDRAHAVSLLEGLARTYRSMAAETQSLLAAQQFPPVVRWDDPQAHQRFFSEFMSGKLPALCGRPCDAVVAALTAVAFDLLSDPGPATVRGRRRMQAANKAEN